MLKTSAGPRTSSDWTCGKAAMKRRRAGMWSIFAGRRVVRNAQDRTISAIRIRVAAKRCGKRNLLLPLGEEVRRQRAESVQVVDVAVEFGDAQQRFIPQLFGESFQVRPVPRRQSAIVREVRDDL